jgi:hypothetical protein
MPEGTYLFHKVAQVVILPEEAVKAMLRAEGFSFGLKQPTSDLTAEEMLFLKKMHFKSSLTQIASGTDARYTAAYHCHALQRG